MCAVLLCIQSSLVEDAFVFCFLLLFFFQSIKAVLRLNRWKQHPPSGRLRLASHLFHPARKKHCRAAGYRRKVVTLREPRQAGKQLQRKSLKKKKVRENHSRTQFHGEDRKKKVITYLFIFLYSFLHI